MILKKLFTSCGQNWTNIKWLDCKKFSARQGKNKHNFLLIEQSREGAFFFLSTKVKDNTSLIKKQTRPKPRANKHRYISQSNA